MTQPSPGLRFAVAGIAHETNTYATRVTGVTTLDKFRLSTGADVPRAYTGTNHPVGGYIAAADRLGIALAHSLVSVALPSGAVARDAYAQMKTQMLDGIRAALPVDGVLFAPHGAGIAEGVDDIEGDMLAAIRALVGPGVPIATVYDLHGNLTEAMIAHCDITLPCRLYPHTDLMERGEQAVELLAQTVRGEIGPVTAMRRIPMLGFIIGTQEGQAPALVNELCAQIQTRPGVLDCSWFHGFPYSDIAAPCPAVVCTTDGDPALAQACADEVAQWIWDNRAAFLVKPTAPADGVRQAMAITEGPVVVNENSDNPGGGTPGDATHLLRALIDAHLPEGSACFGSIFDAETVQQAIAAGVGATINVSLGGKLGYCQGTPIIAEAYVKAITDGRFVNRPGSMLGGVAFNQGPMCRLVLGGIDVLVGAKPDQTWDPEVFALNGIDVMRYHIVAIKGAAHFRAGFRDVARAIVTVDSEGLSSSDIFSFAREKAGRVYWPLDSSLDWSAGTA